MPASFKVLHDPIRKSDTIVADFGESAIGRVAPVDSGFWWIILLRAYTKSTEDLTLAETEDCQKGMRLILTLCLSEGFDTFPTLLCADGCSMIDRRMVNGSESIDEEDQASRVSQFLEGYKEGRIIKERIGGPSFMGLMSSFIGIGTVYRIGFVVVVMMLIRSINKGEDERPAVATGDEIDHASSEAESREHKSGEKED